MIDNPQIKAIFAARGGYGCVMIVNQVNFEPFLNHPKWLMGFSDLTVFHNHINQIDIQLPVIPN